MATVASEDVLCFGLIDLDQEAAEFRKNDAGVRLSKAQDKCRAALLALIVATFSIGAHAQSATEQIVYNFCQLTDCADGDSPTSGMSLLANGSFVVAVDGSGEPSGGAIDMFTPTGQIYDYSPTVLASFCFGSPNACPSGFEPNGPIIQGLNGNIYFTNYYGGLTTYNNAGSGILWQYSPPYEDSLLQKQFYDFCSDANCAAGGSPSAGLTQGSDDALYGTTDNAGPSVSELGKIFRVDSSGNSIGLHTFCALDDCADGGGVLAPLLQAADGNFYGTTYGGGENGEGVVFKMTPEGTYTVLHSFCSGGTGCPDGAEPVGSLVQLDNGNIYGVTASGGNDTNGGTVFYIDTTGAFYTLLDFGCEDISTPCVDGSAPTGGLILGSDGNLYGTSTLTNVNFVSTGNGAAWWLAPSGTSRANNFFYYCPSGSPCLAGSEPFGDLIVGDDGNLYGILSRGGSNGHGAAYLLTTSSWLQPPVQLALSATSVQVNSPVTLSWKVPYAYSKTAQLCGAFVQVNGTGAGDWSGLQTGTYANHAYSGSAVITPTIAGTYTYALTCGGRESGFATLTVTSSLATSATTFNVNPDPVTVGQSAILQATVTGSSGTPTGSVTFSSGPDILTTATLKSGVASFTASTNGLLPATYGLTAKYSGDSTYSASSGTESVKLEPAPTTTALTASPTSVTPPAEVTLTATVKRSVSGATGTPTGNVTFYANGTNALTTVKLNSGGVASITASSKGYPAGKYPITAKYLGDSNDSASSSSAVNVTVN